MLLNTVLTVREGIPGSHRDLGWQEYTKNAVKTILEQNTPIVIMAWGNYAKGIVKELSSVLHAKVLVLEGTHPSPINHGKGFLGGKYFSKANEWLVRQIGRAHV